MGKVARMEWELEDSLYDELFGEVETADAEARRALVLDWVRCGRVSTRKGAELLGLGYRDFLDVLAEHRVPLSDYEDGWLERELGNGQRGSAT